MYAPQGFTPYFTLLVGVAVLVLWFLGGVAAAIAVALNSRRRRPQLALSARATSPDATRLILIFVLYGAAVLGLIVGIVLGNVTGPAGSSFACPSVFQWNALGSVQQGLVSAFDGGQCTGHVARMTVAMVFAFLLAAVAAVVATVLTVVRLTRDSGTTAVADHVRAASDPATPPATLADIATHHPELRLAIARNPATYDELLGWLTQYGDAEVKAAVATRALESAIPPPPPPPASALTPSFQRAREAPPHQPFNTYALLALIFGIGGGTLGIVFGHLALRQIRMSGERSKAVALLGLIVGYLMTVLLVVLFFAALDLDMRLFPTCDPYCY